MSQDSMALNHSPVITASLWFVVYLLSHTTERPESVYSLCLNHPTLPL